MAGRSRPLLLAVVCALAACNATPRQEARCPLRSELGLVEHDAFAEARSAFESKRGDPGATFSLALMSQWGLGVPAGTTEYRRRWQDAGPTSQKLAVSGIKECAESGTVGARMLLGVAYYAGIGVPKNIETAQQYFESDRAPAEQSAIGIIGSAAIAHAVGKKDAADALLESVVSRPIGLSEYSVGAAFYRGIIFDQDYAQAAKWLRRAAEKGDARAQGTLGYMYSLGRGVAKDDREAQYWLDQQASNPARIDEQTEPIIEGYWEGHEY